MGGFRVGLAERMETLGRSLGAREAEHAEALEAARERAASLHGRVTASLERFHAAASAGGAPHLRIEVTPPEIDDKHLRAIQFEVRRGRHRAIVTVKSRAEVTLVGPFRQGKTEGPCRTFPFDADSELEDALGGFLERFIEEAATP